MTKLYLEPLLGDTVYTDQLKLDKSDYLHNKTVEWYLNGHKPVAKYPRPKFKYIGKKALPTVESREKPVLYGPKLPTLRQRRVNEARIKAEQHIRQQQKLSRLSRRNGWTFEEVYAIAASAFIKGLQSAGDIPENLWDDKVAEAMRVSKETIQQWQEYQLNKD